MDKISKSLIARVRFYPFLYDKSHRFYKSLAKKEKTWKTIASESGIAPIVAKRKWKSLRDMYLRYLKRSSGSKRQVNRNWKQEEKWKPMQFLQRYMQPTRKGGSLAVSSTSKSPAETEITSALQETNANSDIELLYHSFAKFVRSIRCPVRQAKLKLQIMELITSATIAIDPNGLKDPAFKCS
ncbi:hypothetical protein AND_009895 [Anopheles darlingi]|uniref:MADF domain-containing protein n=1 Tax=Anopheles darlingi TaxID=43151 RepID=W5J6Y8_ANODA|nr:hypothetical protein AND_009895 [Anopheles darlingi]